MKSRTIVGMGENGPGAPSGHAPAHVAKDLPGRIVAGDPRDATARVAARSALVERFDRRPIVGIVWHGALEKQLVGPELALEDVALRQIDDLLDVRRGEQLGVDHVIREAGREALDGVEHGPAEIVFLVRPASTPQLIRRMPAEQIDRVLAGGRQGVVDHARRHRRDER